MVCFQAASCINFTSACHTCFQLLSPASTAVETVVLLSKLNTKQKHIEVELNLNELDLPAAEGKATYEEIKEYVLDTYWLNPNSGQLQFPLESGPECRLCSCR